MKKKSNLLELDKLKQRIVELEKSEEQFRIITENTSDIISITTFDLKAKYLYISPSIKQIFGYDPEDLLGKSFFDYLHPEDKKTLFSLLTKYVNLKIKKILFRDDIRNYNSIEFRFKNKAGEWRYVQSTVNIVGKQFIAVGRDITEYKKTENKIKKNEEKLRNFVENTTLGIWCFQPEKPIDINMPEDQMIVNFFDSRCIECNDTYANMMGVSKEDILGLKLSDAMPNTDENKEYLRTFIKNEFRTSGSISRELTKDGKEKYFSNSMIGVIKNGKLINAWGTQSDITKRIKAEEEVHKSEEKLRLMIDNSPCGFSATDLKGNYIDMNFAFCNIMGYSKKEMMHKHFNQFSHPDDRIKNKELYEKLVEGKISYFDLEKRYIHKNGSIIYARIRAQLVRNNNGKPLFEIAVIEDITEGKLAKKNLRESEEKYRTLTENMSDIIYSLDRDGIITYISPQTKQYGTPAETLISKNLLEIVHPEDREKIAKEYQKTLETGKEFPSIFRTLDAKKEVHWFEDIGKIQRDKEGNITGLAGVLRDITDRKQTEKIQSVIYNIANVVNTTKDIHELFKAIRSHLSSIMNTDNFYIALYNEDDDTFSLPYHIDEKDIFKSFPAGKTLSAYVAKTGKSLFGTEEKRKILIQTGEVKRGKIGAHAKIWVGVPLKLGKETLGVIAVQSYTDASLYVEKDLEILEFISGQIATAIAQKQSEKSYRDIFNNATDAIYIQDTEGKFLDVNQGAMDMYGYPKKFFIGKTPQFLSAPGKNDMNKITGFIQDALNGKPQQYDFWGIRKNGEIFPKIVRSKRISYLGKDAIITFALDITERKKAEEQEKDHTRKIEILSQTAMQFVDLATEENIYKYIAQKIYNYLEKNAYVMVNSISNDNTLITRAVIGIEKHSKQIMNIMGKNPLDHVLNIKGSELDYLRDGRIHCNAKDLYGLSLGTIPRAICKSIEKLTNMGDIYTSGIVKGNNLLGTIIILMKKNSPKLADIDFIESFIKQAAIAVQKRETEKALIESEQLSSAVIKDSPFGISVRDKYGTLILYNEAWKNIWEFTDEQIESYKIKRTKLQIDEKDSYLGKHQQQIKNIYKNGGSYFVPEMKLKPGNNKAEWIMQRFYAIMDENDKVEKVVILTSDISDRKKAEIKQNTLYNISNALITVDNLHELFIKIRKHLGNVLDTTNFYIALYDEKTDMISLPYDVDIKDVYETFPAGKTLTNYVIKTGKPLFANRQFLDELAKQGEVEIIGTPSLSWLGVPLKIGNKVMGVIAVQSYDNPDLYSKDDLEILTFVSEEIALAINRKQADERIKRNLNEKDTLLRELYHRTKNNMQIISSMLRMQSRSIENKSLSGDTGIEIVHESFDEIINKIKAMSLVHQKLYQAKDLSHINLKEYITDLIKLLMISFGIRSEKVSLNLDMEDIPVLIDFAIPLGLVLNELISNIFKHAFPNNDKDEITIRLYKDNDNTINIHLSDNGMGIPKDVILENVNTMGLQTVFSLIEHQLKGEVIYKIEDGLKWFIKLKDNLYQVRV
ncbi:MAG: PAS domain S-box protein [Candidatus Cloacimonadota bacterium]|nr:PAS domain S-box protein [Candidatus Cloacimonadota bacterium]